MRHWSDSDPTDDSMSQRFGSPPTSGRLRSPTRGVAPRLSLPQRQAIVESTLAEEWSEEEPLPERKPKRARRSSTQALMVHTAQTSPLDLAETASPADLQLIPRTSPAIPVARIKPGWFHTSSPRVTIIKLLLIGLVVFSVLGTTFATAGGGKVADALFTALQSVIPFSPASQPVGPNTVAQRVQPITQADINAGYDSRQQHDTWWDSACSAAAMTEILHAWGVKDVTIGELIDIMYAQKPPLITPWGGLMTQNAWAFVMSNFHMHATVNTNHAMSYNDVVNMTQNQGIPVVLGIRDSGGRYYPAFGVGHFLVAVGGDASGLRIVDSSLYRITFLTIDQLNYLWDGLTVVINP
jgi:hypothetical protein